MQDQKLGFIGLGVMGEPMCRNLAAKSRGSVIIAFDLRPEPLARLATDGVDGARSIAELSAAADQPGRLAQGPEEKWGDFGRSPGVFVIAYPLQNSCAPVGGRDPGRTLRAGRSAVNGFAALRRPVAAAFSVAGDGQNGYSSRAAQIHGKPRSCPSPPADRI